MNKTRVYKLLDGRETRDVQLYLRERMKVAEPIRRATGFMYLGPDKFLFVSGGDGMHTHVSLPDNFAVRLSKYITSLEEDAAKWREHVKAG